MNCYTIPSLKIGMARQFILIYLRLFGLDKKYHFKYGHVVRLLTDEVK